MGKIGEGPSMKYEEHMDKAKGCRFEGGRWGWVGSGMWWVKIKTSLLEKQ